MAIRAPSTVHEFPPSSDFVDKDPFEEPIFAEAPWFHPEFCTNEALIDQHMLGGVLPGGIRRVRVHRGLAKTLHNDQQGYPFAPGGN